MTGVCRVCGEVVVDLLMPLHAEDHAQRGEYPSIPPAPPSPEVGNV